MWSLTRPTSIPAAPPSAEAAGHPLRYPRAARPAVREGLLRLGHVLRQETTPTVPKSPGRKPGHLVAPPSLSYPFLRIRVRSPCGGALTSPNGFARSGTPPTVRS